MSRHKGKDLRKRCRKNSRLFRDSFRESESQSIARRFLRIIAAQSCYKVGDDVNVIDLVPRGVFRGSSSELS